MVVEGDFPTIGSIVDKAKEKLPSEVWDYLMGGAGTEATLRRNTLALDRLALLPAIMRDVGYCDISSTLLGMPMALPVFPAPIGSLDLLASEGSVASARAAAAAGTACCIGLLSHPDFANVAERSRGPLMLQLYIRGDHDWLLGIVRRAEQLGYQALVLTADSAIYARRDRDLNNGYAARRAVDRTSAIGPQDASARAFQAALNWTQFERLRAMTKLPVILKGVMRPAEARMAIELGVDGVYVSNHGGRQLDHAPAAIDQLPTIVEAVSGRVPVMIDGGFMRGTDVVKAIALGASAVGIGKLQGLALAAGGERGLRACLDILRREITETIQLLGCASLEELGGGHVVESIPTRRQSES